jgi:hypothetical protein
MLIQLYVDAFGKISVVGHQEIEQSSFSLYQGEATCKFETHAEEFVAASFTTVRVGPWFARIF